MDKNNAIEVNNITKDFKVYYDKGSELKEKMLFWKRNRYEKRHVLRGISFNVKKGEAIGLVGKNGCGKSTTLKMLTKIILSGFRKHRNVRKSFESSGTWCRISSGYEWKREYIYQCFNIWSYKKRDRCKT